MPLIEVTAGRQVPEILPRLLQRLLDSTSTRSVQNAIVKACRRTAVCEFRLLICWIASSGWHHRWPFPGLRDSVEGHLCSDLAEFSIGDATIDEAEQGLARLSQQLSS